jgi:putative intracellular protease/amidase
VGLDEVMPFLLATRLEELGAKLDLADKFVSHAVSDGRLITGQNPQSSQAVADAMVEALYRE